MTASQDEFISEPIDPIASAASPRPAARGEPSLPKQFRWRDTTYTIAEVRKSWKQSRPEGHRPGGEMYLRRHYWTVRTTSGETMTLYCLRQARPGRKRWWLYTIQR